MSRNSKKKRDRRKAKERRAANGRRQTMPTGPMPLVTVEEVHSPDQLAGFFGMPSSGDFGSDASWTVRVIVSASGKTYADGEHIPISDQQIIESHPVDTLEEAQALGDQLEEAIAESDDYPAAARTSIMSGPEFSFG